VKNQAAPQLQRLQKKITKNTETHSLSLPSFYLMFFLLLQLFFCFFFFCFSGKKTRFLCLENDAAISQFPGPRTPHIHPLPNEHSIAARIHKNTGAAASSSQILYYCCP
jgi:hypothetical protein